MKEYKITEEQTKEAHKWLKAKFKEPFEFLFHECFKGKHKIGKWYQHKKGRSFYVTSIEKGGILHGYGFSDNGIWFDESNSNTKYCACNEIAKLETSPMTESEVFEMLKIEAEKRGYKAGNFECLDNWTKHKNHVWYYKTKPEYIFQDGLIWVGNIGMFAYCIFKNGKWATIVETPKEMTLEEIEKQLGHKVKIVS